MLRRSAAPHSPTAATSSPLVNDINPLNVCSDERTQKYGGVKGGVRELHGRGVDARGIIAPISPYVFIGRGRDFAWSLTSASNQNEQQFLERLCDPAGGPATRTSKFYLYKGAAAR